MIYDTAVICGYFILMVLISFIFKKMASKSSSDYFRGGGRMLWWMVGATAFMTQFSAWTFTGAAGKAFSDGFMVAAIFLGNTIAYGISWLWFAKRFRQVRVDTATEVIRHRFGSQNEHFFTWVIIPLSILSGAVMMNALAIFVSTVFDWDLSVTIWVTGIVVLMISLLSGAWGVVASDFVQTLIVAIISVACAIVALVNVGGPVNMVTHFPSGFIMGPNMNYGVVILGSVIFFIVKQLQNINNMQDSYRFLNAKDSKNAQKAAFFAMILMAVGTLIWFIPPWVSASLYPDATAQYAALGNKASDTIYLSFVERAMPAGTVGLLVAGLFAATMSTMDPALNRNSGIFVRSFWVPVVCRNKKISDRAELFAGKMFCIVNGLLVIIVSLFFSHLEGMSLFDLMMSVSTLAQAPLLVPLFFGMFIKRTPRWAAWGTVVFGIFVSWMCMDVLTSKALGQLLGIEFTKRELSEINVIINIVAHLVLTGGFFICTKLFYRETSYSVKEQQQIETFFKNIETEVVEDDQQSAFDRLQREKIGFITMLMSGGMVLMVLIPNPLWGRLLFLGCAASIFLVGYLLRLSCRVGQNSPQQAKHML
ncbi:MULTISPECIES: sodium:solute symporter family transporter [Buttiauxella]|uniref:Putative sodium-solute symporter n=1 Tax=Buttiauxella gaviniae ATCC 51604 TaxID=1354253 RepID=A0A1B7I361_9ENTR|nr:MULTISPECIES: transporter [Buttiauxella]OAT22697.1 putative sodium-solute symporter [Buttiauxella gaviniae ATCC 51604]TDX17690.1 Na+/proline symporter [Buttiauxella sp. BIGb0552]